MDSNLHSPEHGTDAPCPPALRSTSHLTYTPYVPATTMFDAVAGVCLEHLTGCPVDSDHPLKI